MKTNNGYRGMLRDRIPLVADIVLRYLSLKGKWIDHVYKHFISIYCSNTDKDLATRTILGISSKYRSFDFDKTISWENISEEEEKHWKYASGVIKWLSKYGITLESYYKELLCELHNPTIDDLADKICKRYKLEKNYEFIKFVIKNIKV